MSAANIAYYPGCSQTGTAIEYDMSVRAVARALEITLTEVTDWNCCGSTPAHSKDRGLMAALAARNLRQVHEMGLSQVATPCPSCLAALKTANQCLESLDKKDTLNALLDAPLQEQVPSRSILQVLLEDVGLDAIRNKISKPLKNMVAAPYYGCLLTRPGSLMEFDDQENPTSMDRLLETAGATVPDFPFKVECCGVSFGVTRNEMVRKLSGRILEMAQRVGANTIVVACPLCHQNLDLRQRQARPDAAPIPVLYITQALGLAMGLSPQELGLDKHAVSTAPIYKEAVR